MLMYKVWYQGNEKPFEFESERKLTDIDIIERVLTREHIAAFLIPDKVRGSGETSYPPTLSELIDRNKLAPVRYMINDADMVLIA